MVGRVSPNAVAMASRYLCESSWENSAGCKREQEEGYLNTRARSLLYMIFYHTRNIRIHFTLENKGLAWSNAFR